MPIYLGHEEGFSALDRILRAFEAGRYTRLVQYGPGESVLLDSHPAPDYVPGVLSKKNGGPAYEPKYDGTQIAIFYYAKHKATNKQKEESKLAIKGGYNAHKILGRLISIRRNADGCIQVLMSAGNRIDMDKNLHPTGKVPFRSVSITLDPSVPSGLLVALGVGQDIGIPDEQLMSMAESEKDTTDSYRVVANRVRSALEAGHAAGHGYTPRDPASQLETPSETPTPTEEHREGR